MKIKAFLLWLKALLTKKVVVLGKEAIVWHIIAYCGCAVAGGVGGVYYATYVLKIPIFPVYGG
jgi:hypothetical protein